MKIFCVLLSVGLFFGSLTISAQLTYQKNAVRIGDRIIKRQLPYIAPGEGGNNQLWNFSRLPESSAEYVIEYIAPELFNDSIYIMGRDTFPKEQARPGELIIGMEYYTAYYYRQTDSTLLLLGYENPLTLVHYDEPLCQMRYPLDTLHGVRTSYQAETTYSSAKQYGTEGSLQIFPDAVGSLILPSGDTLAGVTRIKILQTTFSDCQDSVSLPPVTTETYKWYAAGYRYPVFETVRILHADTLQTGDIFKTSFFYPPQDHAYLEDDVPNLAILNEQEKEPLTGPDVESGQKNGMLSGTSWSCNFYPNPVGAQLHVEYRTEQDMPVTITLHDVGGRMLKKLSYSLQKAGFYQETIDTGSLPAGNYVCKFVFGMEAESQIIIKN